MNEAKQILATFTEDTLPDLDTVVLGALELFAAKEVPKVDLGEFTKLLVLGSGNAEVTGRLLFRNVSAQFADESTYQAKLETINSATDKAVVISASGSKHAVLLAKTLEERNVATWLLTNDPHAPAAEHVAPERVLVFPRNREPYTYNTSTYMGMLLGKTGESPVEIQNFIINNVKPLIPNNLDSYDAFYLMIPPEFWGVREMLLTKFDELFGPKVSGRVFTYEQTKHAKTVVWSEKELFISFGVENNDFGVVTQRLHIPLPKKADQVAMMAIGYYVIGHIQKQHPPYFKDRIAAYMQEASAIFNTTLKPIVE